MMTSLNVRLIVSYLTVILIGMGIAAPLAWLTVEQLYLDTQRANVLAQARLVATALQTAPQAPSPGEPYTQSTNALPGIHTHVIETDSAVVIDLPALLPATQAEVHPLPPLAQNTAGIVSEAELLSRPEIAQARSGQPATAIREVAIAGNQRVLYAAAPVFAANGDVSRIVYIASPLPKTGWAALPGMVRWQLAGVILLATLLASAAGWWLAWGIARPLRKLAQAANGISAGDLSQTVPMDTSIAELHDLGTTFNLMSASLRQADQAKTAFVANVSHELRTPLTVIKGNVETLQDGAIDDLEARESFLTSIAKETERLIRLVNDLLVLTRADAGALNLQLEPVHIGDLARARVKHFSGIAARQQVQLRVDEESQSLAPNVEAQAESNQLSTLPPYALADPYRIAQVFDNLLDNAIRHSGPGGLITVAVAPADGEVSCAVSDTGCGIPAKQLPLIFDRFYRVDSSRSRNLGGSGLGLSITRALVLAHGGRIVAQSVEEQGTVVTFWLPACEHCP
jgi:two-component system sensor histidine kinase BaeS